MTAVVQRHNRAPVRGAAALALSAALAGAFVIGGAGSAQAAEVAPTLTSEQTQAGKTRTELIRVGDFVLKCKVNADGTIRYCDLYGPRL